MILKGLPANYDQWLVMRQQHLEQNLVKSKYTEDLYKQYKKHLGSLRFQLLLEGQKLVVPKKVNELLHLGKIPFLKPVLAVYKLSRKFKLEWILKSAILPKEYKEEIKELDVV